MSFGAFANRVRDPALPHRRRVSALRSCVQLYRPIGFHATLGFLRELAGPYESDEAALLRALEALCTSRAGWHAELDAYDQRRRAAKRRGQRSPRPDEHNPYYGPRHWYGAPRQAAVYALTLWRRKHLAAPPDLLAARIDACATACLEAGGPLDPDRRRELAEATHALHERLAPGLWYDDQPAYFRTRDLLKVARLIQTAAE